MAKRTPKRITLLKCDDNRGNRLTVSVCTNATGEGRGSRRIDDRAYDDEIGVESGSIRYIPDPGCKMPCVAITGTNLYRNTPSSHTIHVGPAQAEELIAAIRAGMERK